MPLRGGQPDKRSGFECWIKACSETCGAKVLLKVIIETGSELKEGCLIRRALIPDLYPVDAGARLHQEPPPGRSSGQWKLRKRRAS